MTQEQVLQDVAGAIAGQFEAWEEGRACSPSATDHARAAAEILGVTNPDVIDMVGDEIWNAPDESTIHDLAEVAVKNLALYATKDIFDNVRAAFPDVMPWFPSGLQLDVDPDWTIVITDWDDPITFTIGIYAHGYGSGDLSHDNDEPVLPMLDVMPADVVPTLQYLVANTGKRGLTVEESDFFLDISQANGPEFARLQAVMNVKFEDDGRHNVPVDVDSYQKIACAVSLLFSDVVATEDEQQLAFLEECHARLGRNIERLRGKRLTQLADLLSIRDDLT